MEGVGGVVNADEAVVPAADGWPTAVGWYKSEHEARVETMGLARQKEFLG